jgi:hypothetical protein
MRFATDCKIFDSFPADSQGAGTATTVWIPIKEFKRAAVFVSVGDMGTNSTVDVKVQSATSAAGAGADDISGAALTQFTQAGTDQSNTTGLIDIDLENVVSDGDTHIGVVLTVGTAASEVCILTALYGAENSDQATGADETVVA